MKAIALFALATAFLIGVLGWVLGLVFTAPEDARALWVSAGLALVVQLFGFVLARMSAKSNVIAGWGVGMLLRLLTLGVYVLIQQIEGNLTIPLVMANRVRLHPALVAIGVVVVGQLFGFVGLFVAVPILAAIVIAVDELWVKPLEERDGLSVPDRAEPAVPAAD